jgi:transient receptor potential cation channel subfamily A protein 1
MSHFWKRNKKVEEHMNDQSLSRTKISQTECQKPRHFSLGCIYEHRHRFSCDFSPGQLVSMYKPKCGFMLSICSNKTITTDNENSADHVEIDAGMPPPVDGSLFFDHDFESLKSVKIDGASLKTKMWASVTVTEMKELIEIEKGNIEKGPDGQLLPNADQRFKNIIFLWACFRGLVHLLPKLEECGADRDYVEPCTGMNTILASSLTGSISCLKYLIQKGADVNYVNTIIYYTPLHLAALCDSSEAIELLVNNGASVNSFNCQDVEPVLHCAIRARSEKVVKVLLKKGVSVVQKNNEGETPLHVACFVQSITCTELLLDTPGTDPNAVDKNHRTSLHYAVMNNNSKSKLVELLLKYGASVNVKDKQELTPLHIASLKEQSECVDTLIWAGADISAVTKTGLTALNIILSKIPESLQVFRQRLDASIRLKRAVPHNREFEMRFHFDLLFPSNNQCETSFINTFVQEHQKDLLSHPLVMAFLHLKWEKIRKFYLMRIFLYALTVIFMTTYVLTALAYKCYNLNEANSSKICNNKRVSGFLFWPHIIEIEWYITLILTCVTIPRKVFGFMVYKSARQYFMNIDNVLDTIVIVSVFVTSFVYTGRTYDWQNYVGAFAILCAWTNLMLMVGQLPAFGTYVAMFTHIQFEFAKLLLAYSGLLIGFTISFCVIFVGEPSFGNPFTGLIKVLAMMAGELDFEGLINQDDMVHDGSFVLYHPLSVCSQILFTLFIVFVTVILMNLLVGIAVHDIQGLRNHAGLTKLVRQTKLILFTEMVLYNGRIPYTFKKWMSDHKIDVDNHKKILVVKPLNPLEKRLPKDILKAAYEIAQRNAPQMEGDDVSLQEHVTWLKQNEEKIVCPMHSSAGQLSSQIRFSENEIKFIKKHLLDTNKILKRLLARAQSR